MKQQKRKGFTLVELLVVIAILAILATVSIVGYTAFIKRARQSVDEQFVTQLNTILEAEEVAGNKLTNIAAVQELLTANQVGSFVATNSLNTFYWVGSENRIIIFTKDNADATTGKVTFPENLSKALSDQTTVSAGWYDLSTGATFDDVTGATPDEIKTNLLAAIADYNGNDVIRLPANTTLEFTSTELSSNLGTKDVKIDLNGGTIKSSASTSLSIAEGKTLELSNGKYEDPNLAPIEAAIMPGTSASVVLRNMTIETTGTAVFPAQVASEAIIDNCTIKAPRAYCVATNASPNASKNVKIIITNSTLEGKSPVLVNVPCELEIDNCTIKGNYHGVVVRGGTAVIRNSTITQEYTDNDVAQMQVFFNKGNWGQGNQLSFAALTIGNRQAGSYDYPSHVTLNNVKLIGVRNEFPACYIIGNTTEGNGATLVYDSACTFSGYTDVVADINSTTNLSGELAAPGLSIVKGNDKVTVTPLGK